MKLQNTLIVLFFTALSVILLLPIVQMVSISLVSDQTSLTQTFGILPKEFVFENYLTVFVDPQISLWKGIINSLLIVGLSIAGQVFSSTLVGYAFSRLRAPGKNVLFAILLASMILPGEVLVLSQFIIFQSLSLTNSFWPIVIPNFFASAFNVFLLRQVITSIPSSLDEAAMMDGLGFWSIYRTIIFPLIMPTVIIITVLTFQWNWSDIFLPLIYINDYDKAPLALMLQILKETANTASPPRWNMIMVGSVFLTLPTILVFIVSRRYLFNGESTGSSILK